MAEKHRMKGLFRALILLGLSPVLLAQSFLLSVPDTTFEHFPEIIELVTKAYELEGYQVEVILLPGERAIAMLKTNEIDGDIMRVAGFDNLAENVIRVDVVLMTEDIVALVHSDSGIQSIAELRGQDMAAVRGVRAFNELSERMDSKTILQNSFESSARMVANKRLLYTLATPRIANSLIESGLALKVLPDTVAQLPFYHWVTVKNSALVPGLENRFKTLLADQD